jgi:hypothetical protein
MLNINFPTIISKLIRHKPNCGSNMHLYLDDASFILTSLIYNTNLNFNNKTYKAIKFKNLFIRFGTDKRLNCAQKRVEEGRESGE